MKQSMYEKWVTALESDEYHQANGVLKGSYYEPDEPDEPNVAYCCWGVYCHIFKETDLGSRVHIDERPNCMIISVSDRQSNQSVGGMVGTPGFLTGWDASLVEELEKNNDSGVPFKDIAAKIRRWVEDNVIDLEPG